MAKKKSQEEKTTCEKVNVTGYIGAKVTSTHSDIRTTMENGERSLPAKRTINLRNTSKMNLKTTSRTAHCQRRNQHGQWSRLLGCGPNNTPRISALIRSGATSAHSCANSCAVSDRASSKASRLMI